METPHCRKRARRYLTAPYMRLAQTGTLTPPLVLVCQRFIADSAAQSVVASTRWHTFGLPRPPGPMVRGNTAVEAAADVRWRLRCVCAALSDRTKLILDELLIRERTCRQIRAMLALRNAEAARVIRSAVQDLADAYDAFDAESEPYDDSRRTAVLRKSLRSFRRVYDDVLSEVQNGPHRNDRHPSGRPC